MQLGLVLALLIVYLVLEITSVKTISMIDNFEPDEPIEYPYPTPPTIIIDKDSAPKKKQKIKKIAPLVAPKIVPDIFPIEKKPDVPDSDNPQQLIDKLPNISEPETEIEPLPYILIEEAPVFPGCEGLSKIASKKCFTKQMSKFVNKKFNGDIADGLNLSGKQRIFALFTIDKNGLVTDIKIKTPHKRLEKEALRVIELLPKMVPGKQQKRPVPVKYTLPIIFEVY